MFSFRTKNLINFTSPMVLLLLVGFLEGCASRPEPVALESGISPETAVSEFETDLATAEREKQISVYSKSDFKNAHKALKEAKEDLKDSDDREDVVQEVGVGRAYLIKAQAKASSLAPSMEEVAETRRLAVNSGAALFFPDELSDIDEDFTDETEEGYEHTKNLDLKTKAKLQERYSALELKAIKQSYLGQAKTEIDSAKKMGAAKVSPKTLAQTLEVYQNSEFAIETNRHDKMRVKQESEKALQAAKNLMVVTQLAADSRGLSAEQIALELEAKRSANNALQGQVNSYSQALDTSIEMNSDLSQKSAAIEGKWTQSQIQERAITKATESFNKDEAEVYRQGDNILIRLKKINFQTGSAQIPNDSAELLGKIRDVVVDFKPAQVVVEGHTDSTGSAALNKKLSQKRAKAVATYMVSTNTIDEDAIETAGLGSENPLKPNTTSAGRAMNRRVDLILVPSSTGGNSSKFSE